MRKIAFLALSLVLGSILVIGPVWAQTPADSPSNSPLNSLKNGLNSLINQETRESTIQAGFSWFKGLFSSIYEDLKGIWINPQAAGQRIKAWIKEKWVSLPNEFEKEKNEMIGSFKNLIPQIKDFIDKNSQVEPGKGPGI